MLRWLWRLAAPMVAVALFVTVPIARANTVIVTFLGTAPAGGGLTAFNYSLQLAALPPAIAGLGQGVAGEYDHATVFDFAGFAGIAAVPAGWAPAAPVAPLLGPAAFAQSPTDSGALPNPTINWVGGPITSPVLFPGILTLLSTYSGVADGLYSSEDVENDGVGGPFARSGHTAATKVAAVPLPATANMGLVLLGGLGGLGALRRLKNGKNVEA